MTRSRYFLLGLLLAASVGAYAVSSGGFPFKPLFGSVGINTPAPAFLGAIATKSTAANGSLVALDGLNTSNGTTAQAFITMRNDVPHTAYFGLSSSGYTGQEWSGGPTGEQMFVGTNGAIPLCLATQNTARLCIDGAGVITVNNNSLKLPKFSFGEFIGNAGGCSNNSGVWQTQNMGGTCTRNSVGNYTIAFSAAYAGSPICEAQVTSALAGIAGVNTAGTTTVTVQTGTTAFAAADASFFVTCTGF